jgi:SAM-dependent methyltransferase
LYQCQFCQNQDITEILYLGALPAVNDMPSSNKEDAIVNAYPLPFCHCRECGLTQIGVRLNKEVVFPRTYPYLSGMTKSLLMNFAQQAEQVSTYMQLTDDDLIVDIGSNDGSLLQNYAKKSKVLGVEPTQAADIANSNNIPTLNIYFDQDAVRIIESSHGKARVVTACNVFAHIDNIPELLSNIEKILTPDGIFVSESHYLLDLVNTLQFDTIYHEHLRYYTVTFLNNMFSSSGYSVFRIDSTPSHGGSIRVWACRLGQRPIEQSVQEYLEMEEGAKIYEVSTLENFAKDITVWRSKFRQLIANLQLEGAVIGGLGAPSRASTLVAFTGLTELDLVGVGEVPNSGKLGKNLPGTRIPVITEEDLLDLNPSHLLILSWHIKETIMSALRNKGYKGKFIVPLPYPIEVE